MTISRPPKFELYQTHLVLVSTIDLKTEGPGGEGVSDDERVRDGGLLSRLHRAEVADGREILNHVAEGTETYTVVTGRAVTTPLQKALST